METSLFNRLQATVLAVATAGLIVLAVFNLRQEAQFQQPDDGVWWREVQGGLEAVKVLPDSPAQRAGIQQGDLLTGAEVLPDTAAQRPEMPAQDLMNGEKSLQASPPQSTQIPARKILPEISIVHLADLEHVLHNTQVYGKASYAITRGASR